GAVAIERGSSSAGTATFRRVTFSGNSAFGYGGGAVWLDAINVAAGLTTFTSCIFGDNGARTGGAVLVTNGWGSGSDRPVPIQFTRCLFNRNSTVDSPCKNV